MKHIVCFSKGHSSARVAVSVVNRYGSDNVILLNHDINPKYEDPDIKRFGDEISKYLNIPLTYVNYDNLKDAGKLPSQFDISVKQKAFKQPNSNNSLCTYHLKTLPFENYIKTHFPLQDCVIYYGFDKTEESRIARRRYVLGMMGYDVSFPLAEWDESLVLKSVNDIGIKPPSVYRNFKHANCKGCLKGGIQHWYVVYCWEPEIFQEAVEAEEKLGYSILKRSKNGKTNPFPLIEASAIFKRMKCAGVPMNEHYDSSMFKKQLNRYNIEELTLFKPCECWV